MVHTWWSWSHLNLWIEERQWVIWQFHYDSQLALRELDNTILFVVGHSNNCILIQPTYFIFIAIRVQSFRNSIIGFRSDRSIENIIASTTLSEAFSMTALLAAFFVGTKRTASSGSGACLIYIILIIYPEGGYISLGGMYKSTLISVLHRKISNRASLWKNPKFHQFPWRLELISAGTHLPWNSSPPPY